MGITGLRWSFWHLALLLLQLFWMHLSIYA
jgi:hypothetical protein